MTASIPTAPNISFELSSVMQYFLVSWQPGGGEDGFGLAEGFTSYEKARCPIHGEASC
jgi:hypothetical protein